MEWIVVTGAITKTANVVEARLLRRSEWQYLANGLTVLLFELVDGLDQVVGHLGTLSQRETLMIIVTGLPSTDYGTFIGLSSNRPNQS